MRISVQEAPFEPGDELQGFGGKGAGALVTFTGIVRNNDAGTLEAMEIEHYPGMTQAAFVAEVLDREARKVLQGGGTPSDDPADNPPPPAVLERVEETDKRVAELAEQVKRLTDLQSRTFWQKLRGFRP